MARFQAVEQDEAHEDDSARFVPGTPYPAM